MYRFILSFLLLTSIYANATFIYEGKVYISCSTCYSTFDYTRKVENHYLFEYPSEKKQSYQLLTYVVLGPSDRVIKTFRLKKSVVLDTRIFKKSTDFGTRSFILPEDEYGESKITVSEISNAQDDLYELLLYRDNLTFFNALEYPAYQGSTHSINPAMNEIHLGKMSVNWQGNANFLKEIKPKISAYTGGLIAFHFIDTPLTVEFPTLDGYRITVVATTPYISEWKVLFAEKNDVYYDAIGNQLSSLTTLSSQYMCATNFFNEICRDTLSNMTPIGGILVRISPNPAHEQLVDGDGGKRPRGCTTTAGGGCIPAEEE